MRYLVTAVVAIAVTAAIFLGMQQLVSEQTGEIEDPTRSPPIEMVRVQRETVPPETRRTPPPRPRIADEPRPPTMPAAAPGEPGLVVNATAGFAPPEARLDLRPGSTPSEASITDAAASPIVRIKPDMPRRATVDRIEGVVTLGFDIGPTGRTEGVRVLEEHPAGYGFGIAAVRAVKRWRYRARIVDGQPVMQKGLRIRLSFQHD